MMEDTKRCPFCSEEIKATAIKCKHCGSMLTDASSETPVPPVIRPSVQAHGWHNTSTRIPEGTEIREYRILKLLGEGGMGQVYKAEHTYTGQFVAIKAVHPGLMADQNVRRRFLEEGRVMADLKHPNIVSLLAFFEDGGRFFLVLEYIDGASLEETLRDRRLPPGKAIAVAQRILSALHYAHTRPSPVIHRDIKPANVMIEREGGRVVVMDFGIARALDRERFTRTGGQIGTVEYMSPEQVEGGAINTGSDLYSAGVLLYRMLAGAVPFPQETEGGFEVLRAHVDQAPPPLTERCPDLPPALTDAVHRVLHKDPVNRFPDARAFAEAIRAGVEGPRRVAKSPARILVAQHGHPMSLSLWAWILIGVVLIAGTTLALWRPWEKAQAPDRTVRRHQEDSEKTPGLNPAVKRQLKQEKKAGEARRAKEEQARNIREQIKAEEAAEAAKKKAVAKAAAEETARKKAAADKAAADKAAAEKAAAKKAAAKKAAAEKAAAEKAAAEKAAAEKAADQGKALMIEGISTYKKGHWDEAVITFEKAKAAGGNAALADKYIAKAQMKKAAAKKADSSKDAAKANKYMKLGISAYKKGSHALAIKYFEKASYCADDPTLANKWVSKVKKAQAGE